MATADRPKNDLVGAFRRLGLSESSAKIAAGGRAGLHEATTPTTDPADGSFGKADFAYTPSDDPDTWQLRIAAEPGGEPDPDLVRAAVDALGGTPGGDFVEIPADALPGVLKTLSNAWRDAIPDEELPPVLSAEAATFLALGVPVKGLNAAIRGRDRRR